MSGTLGFALLGLLVTLYSVTRAKAEQVQAINDRDLAVQRLFSRLSLDLSHGSAAAYRYDSAGHTLWIRQLEPPGPNGAPWGRLVSYHLQGSELARYEQTASQLSTETPFPADLASLETLWQSRPTQVVAPVEEFNARSLPNGLETSVKLKGNSFAYLNRIDFVL